MTGETGGTERDDAPRQTGPALGITSVALAIVTIVVMAVGLATSLRGEFEAGTTLAYVATGMSIVAVLGGLSAVLMGRGRGWGVVAIVLGLIANPLLLTKVLGWASGLG
jgi:hypothetical protein